MVYQRGKRRFWWYRFRFGGRTVHESAKTTSKTLAREAERQRRRSTTEGALAGVIDVGPTSSPRGPRAPR